MNAWYNIKVLPILCLAIVSYIMPMHERHYSAALACSYTSVFDVSLWFHWLLINIANPIITYGSLKFHCWDITINLYALGNYQNFVAELLKVQWAQIFESALSVDVMWSHLIVVTWAWVLCLICMPKAWGPSIFPSVYIVTDSNYDCGSCF